MGKLIKSHWARLIVLTAAACKPFHRPVLNIPHTHRPSHADHIAATLEAFFWPKFFFDFVTKNFDAAVKPIPILQTINMVLAILTFAYEWPLKYIAGSKIHTSLEARLLWLPLVCLSSVLLYQATNAALYYLIATGIYFWAFCEGEVSPYIHPARYKC